MNASSWSARYAARKRQAERDRDAQPRQPERCKFPGCCAVQMSMRLHCAHHAALYFKACEKLEPGVDLDPFLKHWGLK